MNISYVISQRLNLQTTKKNVCEFYNIVDANSVKTEKFKKEYYSWADDKKNRFIVALGGRVNFEETKKFIEN